MSVKVCLKCRHKTRFEGAAPAACEACGAIYSKVEEAMRSSPAIAPQTAVASAVKPSRPKENSIDTEGFAQRMRAQTLYPTWRELIKVFTWLGYIIAVCVLLSAAIGSRFSLLPTAVGFGVALAIVILTKVWKELSLMLSDLSDAAVRIAAQANSNTTKS